MPELSCASTSFVLYASSKLGVVDFDLTHLYRYISEMALHMPDAWNTVSDLPELSNPSDCIVGGLNDLLLRKTIERMRLEHMVSIY
jgi:hypothetical protein